MPKTMPAKLKKAIGDPKEVASRLAGFRKSAKALSSARTRMISKYSKRWIALHKGKVVADAKDLNALLKEVDAQGRDRGDVLVRYIDRNARKLILRHAH